MFTRSRPIIMAVRSLKLLGGGGSPRFRRAPCDDDLASEKGHLFAKRAFFSTITWGGGGSCPPPLGIRP